MTRDISSKYAKFYETTRVLGVRTPFGFIKRSNSEDCIKCMLKVPHEKCEAHKYLRVGGGYRHSFWYCKALLEEIELQRQRDEMLQRRLEAIHEKQVKAIKTYIRTKSGRLVEKIIYMSEEDYILFRKGGRLALEILRKYLSKDDVKNLHSYEKEEQKAITTWVRTKSGRRVQRTLYVSKEEYEAMKEGADAASILKKYMNPEELAGLEGWGETEMKQIKTYVRTKSGKLVEKIIMVTKEDYDKMKELEKQGKDPNEILNKYMSLNEGEKVEGWKKEEPPPMKVVKAMVRTKSGKLVEKNILMTEEEYRQFQESGGDVALLRKYLDLDKDDVIENWEKASTVYEASDDEEILKGKPGTKVRGKDGHEYEIVVDPLTGKKYKKRVGGTNKSKPPTKVGRGKIIGAVHEDPHEKGMTKEQVEAYRAGKRRDGSDSEFSYRSEVSAGGTRKVFRKKKNADGTYGKEEEYNEEVDEAGKQRRQKRRQERKAAAIKTKIQNLKKGKRDPDSDGSEFSYRSVHSAGGTRKVFRRRKRADGTYSREHSYHSSQDEDGEKRRKKRREKRMEEMREGKRNPDSDSEFSYRSVVSAGGTRKVLRKKKNKDGTYGKEEEYDENADADGKERRRQRREARQKAFKEGKRRDDSDSDFSYRSVVSAGGTRHVKRRRKHADGTYSAEESYHSEDDKEGAARRRRRRRDRKHAGSAHSYYSVESAGGTRHVRRRKKNADGTYAPSESYHSGDSDFYDKAKLKSKKKNKNGNDSSDSDEGGTGKRKGGKAGKGKKKKGGGPDGNMTDFSEDLQSTASEDEPDLSKMTEEEKKKYFADKAKRKAEREKKRKERYGDKYEEMAKKHEKAKAAAKKKKEDGNLTDFSDDLQSTDSENEPDLENMTEEEKKKYLAEKAKRKAEREKKRKEKYGDKYDQMVEKHKKAKEAKKQARSMVDYAKGPKRFGPNGEIDERGIGLGHDWDKKNSAKRRKRVTSTGSVVSVESYFEVGEDGKMKLKEGQKKIDLSKLSKDDLMKMGIDVDNMTKEEIARALKEKFGEDIEIIDKGKNFDAGDYFEVGEDGKMKLKGGTKKIDLSKLSVDDLKKMGIDPENMTKEEIARQLKKMFGDDVEVIDKGKQFDDGDYFEIGKDGKMKLKDGKKKIDLSKLTAEDLKKMGIDPTKMTKEEISRALRKKFGDDLEIVDKGQEFDDGDYFEVGADGKVKLKKGTKKIDLSKMTDEDLMKLGIDPKYMTKEQIAKKLKEKFGIEVVDGDESDGDYFEVDKDGKVKLKDGKKKIDISKLTKEDLKKLGIDQNASKEEIAKALKDIFGSEVQVTKGGVKVGLKDVDAFDSDADTDDLAYDSDLDVSTLKGEQKVRIMMKRGGGMLKEHMEKMIEQSNLIDDETQPEQEEKDASVDFLKHYQLVDHSKLEMYARAYVVEDEDLDYRIDTKAARNALGGVPTLKHIGEKQVDYVFKLLDLDHETNMTFRMFAVMTALAERVTAMDEYCVELIRIANLTDIERKMALYKNIFYCSGDGDTHPNYIKVDNLKIELMAGGLNWQQQEYLIDKLQPNAYREISFLDYLVYIPLFLSMHDKMLENPFDMSNNKYQPDRPVSRQRDWNPLGYPLRKDSVWMKKNENDQMANDLLQGKNIDKARNQGMDLYNKYQKLPHIGAQSMPGTGVKRKSKKTKALF